MARFIVSLTEDDRLRLEAIRKSRGCRSQADAVRELIRAAVPQSPAALAEYAERHARPALKREGAGFQATMDAAVVAGLSLPLGQTRKAVPKGAKR